MKRWIPLLLAVASLELSAQGTPKTLLWRISGVGLQRASYLFGTVHSTDERAFRFGDSVAVAAGRVDVVAGELDIDATGEQAMELLELVRLPDDKRLEDLYRKKDWRVVEKAIKERLGYQAAFVMRIKPFFVIAMMGGPEKGTEHTEMLDDELMDTARTHGQRVIGLETVEEQVSAMDVLSLEEQAAMLLESIKNGGSESGLDDLLDAYAAQDLDRLVATTMEQEGMPAGLERSLLIDRNTRMAHRMDSIMRGGETAFFAVGAAHLPRDTGLIALLREKGYTVDPVFSVYRQPEGVKLPENDKN
ncbi:MAG: TraB/GumN family protein [Flavobacteriales bacterium]